MNQNTVIIFTEDSLPPTFILCIVSYTLLYQSTVNSVQNDMIFRKSSKLKNIVLKYIPYMQYLYAFTNKKGK